MAARSIRRWILGSFVVVLVSGFAAGTSASAATLYVIPGGATSGPCDGWATACTLQTALGIAASGDELWVEKGVYKPGTNVTDTFTIKPGVAVYGGFAGTESLRSERSPAANVTVLSGDIDNNDAVDANGVDESYTDIVIDGLPPGPPPTNSHNVVTMDGTTGTKILSDTVLDGFTITGGAGGATSGNGSGGGGLYCNGRGTGNECSPTLANLVFSGNESHSAGGAIFLDGYYGGVSSPRLTNVRFTGNHTNYYGGAVYAGASDGESNPTFDHCTFTGNRAQYGGAVYALAEDLGTASPTFTDVDFNGNYAATRGGALMNDGNAEGAPGSPTTPGGNSNPTLTRVTFSYNSAGSQGGAIYNTSMLNGAPNPASSSPVLTNVTFWHNSATDGGAIYDDTRGGGKSDPVLTNVTFSVNSAHYGGAIYNYGDPYSSGADASAKLVNVILWGDTGSTAGPEIYNDATGAGTAQPTIDYSVVENGNSGSSTNGGADTAWSSGTGNLSGNPNLVPLQFNGGFADTAALGAGSSAINTAEGRPVCPATDERGISRPQGAGCDVGAYEAQTVPACLAGTKATVLSATGALQTYTVPSKAAAVLILAQGASGGAAVVAPSNAPGVGAEVDAEVPVAGGSTLDVLVGSQGSQGNHSGGGGGGSFVFTSGGELLAAAGGGGGVGTGYNGGGARLGPNGGNGGGASGGLSGTSGYGGTGGTSHDSNGGGGGGYLGAGSAGNDGQSGAGGHRVSGSPPDGSGGAGSGSGTDGGNGGYGAGGGGGLAGGGGGGGFSGGGGGDVDAYGGGGGGSYAAPGATYLAFNTLASPGDGSVTICGVQGTLAIPTLSPWALLLLALGLAFAATPMLVRRS